MYNDKAHVTMEPKTRTLIIPKETKCIGVVGDNKGERVDFDIPRYYDGIDLGTKRLYIVVNNDPGEGDTVIPDVTKDEEQLHISWTVLDKHVAQEGGVTVRIEAKDDDGFCWQSFDGEFEVRGKQDGEQNMPDAQITAVEQTLQEMEAAKNHTLTAAAAALAASAHTAAPIVPEKDGEVITVNDGANRAVRAIKIYGRTTQSGTPTPSTPRPLVTVGADGDVKVSAKAGLPEGGNEHITIINQPRNMTTPAGTNAVFHVDAVGDGLTYQWTASVNGGGTWMNSSMASATTSTLTLAAKAYQNGYLYRCQITDANGNTVTTDIATLTIGEPTATENPVTVQTATITTPNGMNGVPVTSGGNYTDANGQQRIADTIEYNADAGTAKWTKRANTLVFDGSEDEGWRVNGGQMQLNVKDAIFPNSASEMPAVMCDKFEAKTANQTYDGQVGVSLQGFGGGSGSIFIRYGATADVAAWRNMLAEEPMMCIVALAEPIETQLSAEETAQLAALMTHHPNTTIYNEDGAHMEIKYVADTKNYIDKKIEAIAAAMLAKI